MPQLVEQDNRKFREIPIEVREWGGMLSNYPDEVIPPDGWKLLLNMMSDGRYRLTTRKGSIEFMGNSVTGSSVEVVNGFYFKKTTDLSGRIVFATSDGKLYYVINSRGSTPNLIGSLTNTEPINVRFAQLNDNLYISDGVDALCFDGTTLTSIKSSLPSITPLTVGNINYVEVIRSQLVWTDVTNDYIYMSGYNLPDEYTDVSTGAFKAQISYGDGAMITSIVPWGRTMLVNKIDEDRDYHLTYWLRGSNTSGDPYIVTPLFGDEKSPVAFIGESAIQIRGDVIGLTLEGFTSVSAINNFQEASPGSISDPIDDWIERINFNIPWKITAVYDIVNKLYICSVPLDGANYVTHSLVYDVEYDKWYVWDNWTVRCWVRIGKQILYGTENGRFVQIGIGHNDEGSGFRKEADRGKNNFGGGDIVKLFKSNEIDIQLFGDYTVSYYYTVDGVDITAASPVVPVPLGLLGENALWNDQVNEFWNVGYWNLLASGLRTVLIMARGKTLGERFLNTAADQPFTIISCINRVYQKDAGQAKTG